MNKSICVFSVFFYPHYGGVERYSHQLAKKLIDMGYNLTVVTTNTNKVADEEFIDGIRVIRLPVFNFLKGRLPLPKFNKKFFQLIKLIKKSEIDFFLLNVRFYIHSLVGAKIAKGMKKPSLLIEHGTGHFTLNNPVLDFIGQAYEHSLTAILKHYVKNFFGVSEACCNWLKHFKIKASGVFYNGIDTSYSIINKRSIKEEYGLSNDSIILSFIGRLIPEKGIVQLCQAFDDICKKYNNVYLCVAGDGPLFTKLKADYTHNVIWMGKIEYDQVMNLLDNTDIFILPTDFPEGLPTTVLEAGINNCAIIATPKGGTPEVIIDDRFGIVIKNNTNNEISVALEKLLKDQNIREIMALNLKNRIIEKFDWGVIAHQVSDKITEIASSN